MSNLNQNQLKIKTEKILKYFRKPLSIVTEIIVLIAFTVVAYTFLLYFAKYLWVIFTATDVGQIYAEIYKESYRITNDVLSRDIISLAINLTLTSCLICLIIGVMFKFLHIIRYFYSGRGFWGRTIFTGLPLTYIVAYYIHYTGNFSHMDTAVTVAFVPTLCVFTGCFRFAEELVPELVDVKRSFSAQQVAFRLRRKEEEVSRRANELTQKEDMKKSGTNWQIILQDMGESFAEYIMVILIIIVVACILLIIPQIQNFKYREVPAQPGVSTDTAIEQKTEPLKKVITTDSRFIAYPDKTVLDKKTSLMWAAEESETLNWHEAKRYCKNFRGGGYNDWRMPTVAELEGLYDENKQPDCGCVTPLIEMYNGDNCWEWSSETKDSDAAFFAFNLNGKQWLPQSNKTSVHIRPVRSYK